ncbi:Methionine ABC transporter permease protein [Raoultella ornithinolytica]|nr:Methionine ABC transporter permease protein [Raoultella ornithinolytica]
MPVTIGAFPFFARLTENALDEVDYGRIEAILSMGGTVWHVIFKSLLPEALPTLLAGVTLTIVMLIGFSSMAGVIGGGGLGDLAIRYGYQRFNNEVMVGTVLILVPWCRACRWRATPGPPTGPPSLNISRRGRSPSPPRRLGGKSALRISVCISSAAGNARIIPTPCPAQCAPNPHSPCAFRRCRQRFSRVVG